MVYYFECNQCNRKFTRKWNAFRHAINIHDGFATIHNNQTGIVFINDEFIDDSFSTMDHPAHYKKGDELDQKVLQIYGKIIGPFEELEKLCNVYPESERIRYLSNVINIVLISRDPIKTIRNIVNFNRSVTGKIKIVSYADKNLKMGLVQTEASFRQFDKK